MKQRESETGYAGYIRGLEETLKETRTHDEIMQLAVGGSFEAIGIIERELLIQHGLGQDSYLIDVGCGSGRLARPLSTYLRGRYLGIDIVPALVEHAREGAGRPDWRFEVTSGLYIPEESERADMVCFFSVFTHLRHEETYHYLREAKRVLKHEGRIVFSFLEFPNPHNWPIFENDLTTIDQDKPLNQFASVDAIRIWAMHLDLRVVSLNKAGRVSLSQPFQLQDGSRLEGNVLLGQSVAALVKEPEPVWRRKLNNGLFRFADALQRIRI